MIRKFIFLAFFTGISSQAQIRNAGDVEISPFFGYLSSNYYGGQSVKNNKSISNVYFGASLDFYQNEKWSIKTGLEYLPLGSSAIIKKQLPGVFNTSGTYFAEAEENLNFIAIPFHMNYHFGKKRNWNFEFGPTFSHIISAKSDGEKISKGLKKFQFGLGLGVGYNFIINDSFSLAIEHQEYLGVINNFKKEKNYSKYVYIFNYYGSFNLKAVFKIDKK